MITSTKPLSLSSAATGSPDREQVSAQQRMVKLFYDLAYVDQRNRAGLEVEHDADRHQGVRTLMSGDPGWGRRSYRRLPLLAPAELRARSRRGQALVLNMSAGGLYLATMLEGDVDDIIQVKLAGPGAQYLFPCVVRRADTRSPVFRQLAVELSGIPLELRTAKRDETSVDQPLRPVSAVGAA